MEGYHAQNETINYEAALDEATANYAGEMLADGKVLDDFITKHRKDRSLLEQVRDAIRTLVRKLTGAERRQAQTAEGKLTKALEASAKQVERLTAQKNTATEGGEGRYSINSNFKKDIERWNRSGRAAGKTFVLGSTGSVLQGLGAIESDIYMNGDKISTILKEHPEMTLGEIERLPEILEDPTLVLSSKGTGSRERNTRLVLFGSVTAENGKPILSVLDLLPVEGGFAVRDMQKVNSAYTKENPDGFLSTSMVLHADKKRTIPLLRSMGLQYRPTDLLRYGSMGSISYSGQNVKITGETFSSIVRKDTEPMVRQGGGLNLEKLGLGAGQKNTATEGGETKYSIKRTSKMTLAEQLKAFYDGKLLPSDALYFGETPSTLDAAGLDPLPLAFTTADFKKSTKQKHNVPRRVWKNLNDSLDNALFAFAGGDRVGVMTGDIDGDGKPLLVGIERNATMDRAPVNAIRSVYGLDNPGPWLQNQLSSGKKLIKLDEKRASTFLQTYGAYSATVGGDARSTEDSVPQNAKKATPIFLKSSRKTGKLPHGPIGELTGFTMPTRPAAKTTPKPTPLLSLPTIFSP